MRLAKTQLSTSLKYFRYLRFSESQTGDREKKTRKYHEGRQPQYAKDGGIYSKLTGVLFVFVFLFSVVALYLLVKELATMSFLDFTR